MNRYLATLEGRSRSTNGFFLQLLGNFSSVIELKLLIDFRKINRHQFSFQFSFFSAKTHSIKMRYLKFSYYIHDKVVNTVNDKKVTCSSNKNPFLFIFTSQFHLSKLLWSILNQLQQQVSTVKILFATSFCYLLLP